MEQTQTLLILISLPLLVLFLLAMRLLWLFVRRNRNRPVPQHRDLLLETLHEKALGEREALESSKQSTLAYESLNALHRTIMTHMPVGVLVVDVKRRIQYANPESMQLLGVDSVTGQALSEVSSDLALEYASQQATGFQHEKRLHLELKGKALWLNLGIEPLPDNRTLITIRDQTRLQRLEEQVRYKRDLALMGEMAGGVTHEIKNSLATIQGRVQLLAYGDVPKHSEKIMTEINHLLNFVGEFMKSSRQEQLNRVPFPAGDWLTEMAAYWKDDPLGANVHIELQAPKDAQIHGDKDKLTMMARNLILNGIQACEEQPPDGDVWVRVHLDSQTEDHLTLIVEDKGPGFSENARQKLFVPFVSSKEKGSGLGLFHARKIMMAHGGELSVETGPPTRLKCRFPQGMGDD